MTSETPMRGRRETLRPGRAALLASSALTFVSACGASSVPPGEREPRSTALLGADFPRAPETPPLPQGPLTKIVIGSCIHQDRDQTGVERMTAQRADLAILMGDSVYGAEGPMDAMMSTLRAAYTKQARRAEFQRLVSSTPTLVTWDDHDFGANDGSGETFPQRDVAKAMFDTFWRIGPSSPQAHPDGVYGAYAIGPAGRRVQIILLDIRYSRSPMRPTDERDAPGKERFLPDDDPARTMLGAAQWAWLEARLREPAELRLLVSSVHLVADGHGWERWGNFPRERQRLFDLIRSTGAKGVVVLSGDRHYASINRLPADAAGGIGYPLYDFTSSGINVRVSAWRDEAGPLRILHPEIRENYGVIEIDWAGRAVTLTARGLGDEERFRQPIPFSELGLP